MTSVVRFTEITNGTGAVLTAAVADNGDEYACQHVRRVFVAADIGAAAGQTRDAASNPTLGCLVAQFTGSRVRAIVDLTLYRGITGTHVTVFNTVVIGTGANTAAIGLHSTYNAQTGVTSIYLLDTAAAAPGQIAANDYIEFDVLLGDSVTPPTPSA